MTAHESPGCVLQILGIERTVTSVYSLSAFYQNALDFSVLDATERLHEAPWDELLGSPVSSSVLLGLGEQRLRLMEFASPGKSYPADSNSADLWFQHFAIVTADMGLAYARLQSLEAQPISENGPQQLPPATGNVLAYKFRDPDGHPLELITFPVGTGDPKWEKPSLVGTSMLGIDHSALSVSDAEASIAFYCDSLGFWVASRQTNSGAAQERLDVLPRDTVDVIGLVCAEARTPHIELLAYRQPKGRKMPELMQPADIAGDRLILRVDNLAAILTRLNRASIIENISSDNHAAALIRDPDGHLLILTDMITPHQGV